MVSNKAGDQTRLVHPYSPSARGLSHFWALPGATTHKSISCLPSPTNEEAPEFAPGLLALIANAVYPQSQRTKLRFPSLQSSQAVLPIPLRRLALVQLLYWQ